MSASKKNPYLGKEIGRYIRERSAREPEFAQALLVAAEKRELAQKLKALRESRHVTQQEVARRAGKPQSAIARLERGDVEPRFDLLTKVARALGFRLEIRFVPAR
jgi:DNA-binding XRE family transcriptional regulator